MNLQKDPDKLEVYTELRKSKLLVGTLAYTPETKQFTFEYDRKYLLSKNAIPIGPELPLKRRHHVEKGKLFPSFSDRIPSRENPAYEEYCTSQGVSPEEKNPIILLTSIGRRGPSTFVFEPVYVAPDVSSEIRFFRKQLGISLRELAAAFDINLLTLSKVETGKSTDKNTLKLLSIYLRFPEVALWQIRLNQRKLHQNAAAKLISWFKKEIEKAATQPGLF